MPELRKDYLLDRWVLINEHRGKRPSDYAKQPSQAADASKCAFCPGNEEQTPPEISRVGKKGNWLLRIVPNKFPAVEKKPKAQALCKEKFFQSVEAIGAHEIIIETPKHNEDFAEQSVEHIALVLKTYQQRIKALSKIKGVQFVCVFKNKGKDAGASFEHSHTQIVAYNQFPKAVEGELAAFKKASKKNCAYCEIIQAEQKSSRLVFENPSCVAIAPFASQYNFEVAVFPKKHANSILELNDKQLSDFAFAFKNIFSKLKQLNAPYNLILHGAPKQKFHFFFTIAPRLSTWAGFEYSTGTIINTVPPEKAAEFYRQ